MFKKLRSWWQRVVERLQKKYAPHTLEEKKEPTVEVKPPLTPKDSFESVEAMAVWINMTGYQGAVALDGVLIKSGFGPAVSYVTQIDGSIRR